MSRVSGLTLCLLLAFFSRGLPAQNLDDRRVGLFFEYAAGNVQDPGDLHSRLAFGAGGGGGVYVALTRWLRWDVDFTGAGRNGLFGSGMVYGFTGPEFTK